MENDNTMTREKKEYLNRWNSYIEGLNFLILTPNKKLSQEVENTILKLKDLVVKVAEDKGLK